MTLTALKLELIQKIIACDDLDLLTNIKAILTNANPLEVNEPGSIYEKTEKVLVFNEWQEEKINRALQQYENGECISDEEAQKEIQALLED
jgi:hypothetical protein